MYIPTPRALEGTELLLEMGTALPTPAPCWGLPPPPSSGAKANLRTGFLPLVGGHNQVGDDEEDVLPLRNQRGVKEPPTALLEPSFPGLPGRARASAWVWGQWSHKSSGSHPTHLPTVLSPLIGSFQTHTYKPPLPHKSLF